jgi:hypothetical protein
MMKAPTNTVLSRESSVKTFFNENLRGDVKQIQSGNARGQMNKAPQCRVVAIMTGSNDRGLHQTKESSWQGHIITIFSTVNLRKIESRTQLILASIDDRSGFLF